MRVILDELREAVCDQKLIGILAEPSFFLLELDELHLRHLSHSFDLLESSSLELCVVFGVLLVSQVLVKGSWLGGQQLVPLEYQILQLPIGCNAGQKAGPETWLERVPS